MMRIVQLNMDRARVVSDELRSGTTGERWKVALVQEPYCHGGQLVGLGPIRVFAVSGDGAPMAAALVADDRLNVVLLSHLSSRHVVVVSVERDGGRPLYLVSAYCQYADDIAPYLDRLGHILRELRGEAVVVGMDANARSRLWHSHECDPHGPEGRHRRPWERGEQLEDLVYEWDLTVLNRPNQPATFHGAAGGASNIDVTLATAQVVESVAGWEVASDSTSSQHSTIVFSVHNRSGQYGHLATKGRFDCGRANWGRYQEVVIEGLRASNFTALTSRSEIERAVRTIEGVLVRAASESMPVVGRRPLKALWWSPRLERKRREVLRLRNRVRRLKLRATPEDKNTLKQAKMEYDKEVQRARLMDWRRFVTDEGVGEPWGRPYRIARGGTTTFTLASLLGQQPLCWTDAAQDLLRALFPDDSREETVAQSEVRDAVTRGPVISDSDTVIMDSDIVISDSDTRIMNRCSDSVIEAEVGTMRRGKAPGLDRVEVEMLVRGWHLVYPWYCEIFRACMDLGVFPSAWKIGKLCVLRKGGDRDPSDPKSLRPLCLLSVPGKVLEKLVVRELGPTLAQGSASQFGFVRGRSTVDALLLLQSEVRNSQQKYVLGVFVDIRGAFDNVWWPAVLQELLRRGVSPGLYRILADYFANRWVEYREGGMVARKELTKGCPQGSVLGPRLWNILFDVILNVLERMGAKVIAYADDLVVLVERDSRRALEVEAERIMSSLVSECDAVKLTIAREKTVMMLLKGSLSAMRPPVVRVGNGGLRYVTQFKYLGVTLGERLSIDGHVRAVGSRALDAFMKVCRLAGSEWGIGYRELLAIYRGLFLGILLYGVQAWAPLMGKTRWRKLGSVQRRALLKVNRAYRTSATCAMPVLAGVLPVRYEGWRRWAVHRIRRDEPFTLPDVAMAGDGEPTGTRKERMGRLNEALLDAWQVDWDNEDKGRLTHRFLPSVRARRDMRWIVPTHELTQFVVGHGEFSAKLFSLGLRQENQPCACGGIELADHVLLECRAYAREREVCHLSGVTIDRMLASPDGAACVQMFAEMVLPLLSRRHHALGN